MSKEVNVSRETAKLAKAKGFDWETSMYYYKLEPLYDERVLENWSRIPNHTSAPTQSLLQKWLRGKYKIQLTVIHRNDFKNGKESYDYLLEGTKVAYRNFNTWEKALESGLLEALKLITI